MQYLFLIIFALFTFSSSAEAANCSQYDTWDPRHADCITQQNQGARPATVKRSRPTQQQQANKNGTCVRDVNWRSSCLYGWDDVICGCKVSPNDQGSNAGNNNGQSATEGSAIAGQMVQQCQADVMQAQVDCDQDKDTGIQGAQTTLSNFAVQMGSQMGIQGACSGLGKALIGANGAVTAFSYMCSNSQSKCKTSCRNAINNVDTLDSRYAQVDQNYRSCIALDAKINQASQAIGNMVSGIQGAQSCAEQTGTDLFDYCKSNPSAIGCSNVAQDCSNPTVAASNPICICKANPTASTCVALNLKAGDGFQDINGGGSGGAIPNTGSTNADGIDGLLNDVSWQGDPNLKPSSGPGEDVGGAKGGRPLMEGSGSAGGGSGGGNGGGSGTGVAVNAGFRTGGGGGWFGGGSSGNGGYAGAPAGQAPNGKGGPDLRQFLPGGKFDPKNRGLAGISGPDGITGPHTDIWKKINNRYQIEKSKLMP